jgi:hypothetical protein
MEPIYLEHYVEFMFPPRHPSWEPSSSDYERITKRDPDNVTVPEGAYCFRFYDLEACKAPSGEILRGEPANYSGFYFIAGSIQVGDDEVRTPFGNHFRFYPEDTILVDKKD